MHIIANQIFFFQIIYVLLYNILLSICITKYRISIEPISVIELSKFICSVASSIICKIVKVNFGIYKKFITSLHICISFFIEAND